MKLQNHLFLLLGCFSSGIFAQNTETKVVQDLRTDIAFLASDQMQGRLAGSPQDKESAEYIANQLKKAGLTPFNGLTFQTFDIVQFRIATSKSLFELHFPSGDSTIKTKLVMFRDFYPISESGMNDSCYGLPIYCGFGIEAPQFGYNSYKELTDLKGKVFLISLGFPGDDTTNMRNPLWAFADVSVKIKTAMAHGASGVVFLPGSSKAETPKGELQRNVTTYPLPVVFLNKELQARGGMYIKLKTIIGAPVSKGYNVFGYKNNHKKNTVIICAHHDHLGHNEYKNSLYTGPSAIHNGADDNASGVAAMLELARTLKGKKYKKNNYLFVSFSGEELGLLGSKYFLQQNTIPTKNINYVVNIDMLGRLDSNGKTLVVNGSGTSPQFNISLGKIKNDTNQIRIIKSPSGLGPSDHASFYLDSIPVLHFFTGQHSDYHKPSDDESKINYHGMFLSYNIIMQTIAATNKAGKLKFTKTVDVQPGRRNFKVTMGLMPDYTFTGGGMRIDGVTDGKPAQKAGIMKGDIITQINDYNVSGVEDYMKALQNFEKGQKVKVHILRNGEHKIIEVEF